MRFWRPRYFMVTIILTAAALMAVRVESVRDSLLSGKIFEPIGAAEAEDTPAKVSDKAPANQPGDKKPESKDQAKAEEKPAADKKAEPKPTPSHADGVKSETKANAPHVEPPSMTAPKEEEKKADDAPKPTVPLATHDLSEGEIEVLKQLSGRRSVLDKREEEITQKSAILQAAEMRVDQKIKQMEALQKKLQSMLGQLDEQQQAQINNLVKIYESMKPKEAARILQTLDMGVLLNVMRQMKPAKSAPILAEMESAKAKDITLILAKKNELPDAQLTQ